MPLLLELDGQASLQPRTCSAVPRRRLALSVIPALKIIDRGLIDVERLFELVTLEAAPDRRH